MTARPLTFLFTGVGGQGALSAAGFLGEAVFRKGTPVTVSQLHGMSQRGGSVQAAVTVGVEQVLSPASQPIDVLIGLELIEAARVRERLASPSFALCNEQVIPPPLATLHHQHLPDAKELVGLIGDRASCRVLDGVALAHQAGNVGALNAVMLGALSCLPQCPVSDAELLAAMLDQGSPRAREFNQRAFALGRQAFASPAH